MNSFRILFSRHFAVFDVLVAYSDCCCVGSKFLQKIFVIEEIRLMQMFIVYQALKKHQDMFGAIWGIV